MSGSLLVYFFQGSLAEPRRFVVALVAAGFLLAPPSDVPLRTVAWLLGVAVVAWASEWAGSGGVSLWLLCSLAGAALVVRGGSRAVHYYLPQSGNEPGAAMRRRVRGQLLVSAGLFVVAYLVSDPVSALWPILGSAVFFMRYLLLQAKYLSIQSSAVLPQRGIVPRQRWPLLLVFLVIDSTELPGALVGAQGRGRLLVTSALLLVLAALVFVLALVRMGWPRPVVRRASFGAGIGLAVGLTAVLVELEGWGPPRYAAFANACIGFFILLPFVKAVTKLYDRWPRLNHLVAPPVLSAMMAPVATVSGAGGTTLGTFLAAFAFLSIVYHLVVATRQRADGRVFLLMCLVVLVLPIVKPPVESVRVFQVFLLSLGFVLYSVDLFQRSVPAGAKP